MKDKYFLKVFLSFLLALDLIALMAGAVVFKTAFFPSSYKAAARQSASLASEELKDDFEALSHTTAIPAEVYTEAFGEAEMESLIEENISAALAYIRGRTDSYDFSAAYTSPETAGSITDYYEAQAEENSYEKNEVYEASLEAAIKTADEKIASRSDVFRFSLMKSAHILSKLRKLRPLLMGAMAAGVFAALILVAVLVLLEKKNRTYWPGCSLSVSGLTVLGAVLILNGMDVFSKFTLKIPSVYLSITTLFNSAVSLAALVSAVCLVAGVVLVAYNVLVADNS